jgi:farnesol dehydrogenase
VRILITGGTGYLGRAIVRAVADRGHAPVVFARSARTAGLPGEAIDGDVRDRTALVEAARGCDALCHSAALVSLWRRDRSAFDAVNVGGLRHAIDAVGVHGITRLVYTSSFLARPPQGHAVPIRANDYQRSKVEGAALAARARADGSPIVVLYPGVVYGPGRETEGNLVGRLLHDHQRGRLPAVIGPERVWSLAWIDDVARAHVVALERAPAGSEYALGGENVPMGRLFALAREFGAGPRLPRRLPYPIARAAGAVEELRARLTGAMPLLTRGAVEIFRHDWPLDSARAVEHLDYHVTPLRTGIAETLASWAAPPNHLRTDSVS